MWIVDFFSEEDHFFQQKVNGTQKIYWKRKFGSNLFELLIEYKEGL